MSMVRDDYYGTLDELRARRWTFWDADRRETSEKRIRRPPATRSLPRSLLPPYRAAYPAGCSETSASLSLSPSPAQTCPAPPSDLVHIYSRSPFRIPALVCPRSTQVAQRTAQTRDQILRESRGARGSLGIPQKPWFVALRQVTESTGAQRTAW